MIKLKETDLFTRLLHTRPLFSAALFFMLGCLLACRLDLPPAAWIALAALCIAALILVSRLRRRYVSAMLVLLMLPLGAMRFDLAWFLSEPAPEQAEVLLSGRIVEDPVYNAETERCICILGEIRIDSEPFRGKLRLYLRGDDDQMRKVRLAQDISCNAKLWQGDPASNFAQFSFDDYLRVNNLRGYATAKIEDAALSEPDYGIRDLDNRLRALLRTRIDRLFPESAAIVKAFILGDRSEMDRADRESYSKSGAAHLLAISGMHISVLAMLAAWILQRFLSRRSSFLVTLGLLLLYGWLIGFSPSLLRAVIMFAVYQSAGLAGRYSDAPTRLAFSALIHLLIAPMDILSSSFILSYCASAGIVLLSRPLSRLFCVEDLLYGSMDISPLSMPLRRCTRWIMRSVITSLSAMLATLPAVIHFFGAQPVWTLLINLAAVPLAMLSYVCSLCALIIGIAPLCICGDALFGLLSAFVRFCAALPLSSLQIARLPWWLCMLCAALCLLASDLSLLSHRLRRFLPLCILPVMLISNGLSLMELHMDGLVFMDAGQADCALLKTGGKVYLFDIGDSYTPAADYISAKNFPVDGLFISHPHSDHAGGLETLLEVCVPEKIYISANYNFIECDEGIQEALALARDMGSEIITVKTGDEITLSTKSFAKVLAPDAGISHYSANEDSLILHVCCSDVSALFTGDMPASAMPDALPDVDILKVAHHGSQSSVDARLLTELSPSVAIIPVGKDNSYGHPANETLALLEASGALAFRTDVCGAINIRFAKEGRLEISSYNGFGGSQ